MDKTNYCNVNASSSLTIDLISTTFPIVSVVTCALALVLIAYYKLHHSFNYKLVLYLLVAHLMNSTSDTLQIPFLWLKGDIGIVLPDLCVAVAYMKVYCSLSVALSTTVVMVEIFSRIMCYNLRSRENTLIFICFFLPHLQGIMLLAIRYYGSNKFPTCWIRLDNCQTTLLVMYMYRECFSIHMVALAVVALSCLIYNYMYVGLKQTCTKWEEQHLSNQHITTKYQDALKEKLPFVVYPTISLATLLIYYLHFLQQDVGTLDYITALIGGSAGAICSGAFIIHLCAIGARKRNAMKCSQQAYKSFASKTEGHKGYLCMGADDMAVHVCHILAASNGE